MPKKDAKEILDKAVRSGAMDNIFFSSTFKRYQVQLQLLDDLEKEIKEMGTTVTKEYVKGRQNIYTNPAIIEYNKTSTAANNTVATLLKIVGSLPDNGENKSLQDELNDLLK